MVKAAVSNPITPTGIPPVYVRIALNREGENERNFNIVDGYCWVYAYSGANTIAHDLIKFLRQVIGKANPEPGEVVTATFHNDTGAEVKGTLTVALEKIKGGL